MPQLKPTRGIRLNKSHPLARGLVGCLLFNEGSGNKVFDLSGNGNTGSLVADTHFVPGKFGSALDFDGTGDYVNLGDSPSLNFSTSLSAFAWIKTSDTTNEQVIFESRQQSGAYNGWRLRITNEHIVLLIDTSDGTFGATEGTIDIVDGTWHHVGITWNGTDMKGWVDGVADVDISCTGTISKVQDTYIGYGQGQGPIYFNGLIDHAMIFNRALSASEIALLYREPFCMFERAWIPKFIGGQIVELAGSSVALSSSSATAKAMRKVGGNVVGTSDVAALLNLIHSLLYIERNWLREALFNGMTANAFKLGTTLSLGWFWVRVAGCSVLYRGSSMGEIDFVNTLAVSEQDAREISPPSYISHNSGSTYFYVVRRFNNCGYQEYTLAASVKVSIESNGELAEPQPNKVFDSEAELVDGNKIQLVWYYCPLEQKSQPTCFNVYYDGRTGQIDYENPLAIIGYERRKFYSYQCGALEAGRYLFAIRTENASGKENSSLAQLRIQFDPTNPAAIDILSVEGV